MALRAVVSDLSTVDESLHSYYTEKNGKFVLSVEAADGYELDNVAGLKTALASERSITAGLKGKLSAFEGLDAESARQAQARLAEFGDLDPVKARQGLEAANKFASFNPEVEAEKIAETKLKNAKAQLQADFLNEKTTLEQKLTGLSETLSRREAQIKKGLKETAITVELSKLNPLDEARDALEIIASNVVEIQEINGEFVPVVVNADRSPRVKLGENYESVPFTISDLMAEMREKRAALFKPDQTRGAGLGPATEGKPASKTSTNPFIPGPNFNLTEQMILLRNDPKKAAAFQAEAGQ